MKKKRVEEHLGLVHMVMKQYIHFQNGTGSYTYEDLFQVGCIGLWKATQSYVSGKSQFSTYACLLIRNEIYNELCKTKRFRKETSVENITEYISNTNFHQDPEEASFETQIEKTLLTQQLKPKIWNALQEAKNESSGITKRGIEALEYKLCGMKCSEIAAFFQAPVNHITAWIARARKYLKTNKTLLEAAEELF